MGLILLKKKIKRKEGRSKQRNEAKMEENWKKEGKRL